jgi:hypothetical protein
MLSQNATKIAVPDRRFMGNSFHGLLRWWFKRAHYVVQTRPTKTRKNDDLRQPLGCASPLRDSSKIVPNQDGYIHMATITKAAHVTLQNIRIFVSDLSWNCYIPARFPTIQLVTKFLFFGFSATASRLLCSPAPPPSACAGLSSASLAPIR